MLNCISGVYTPQQGRIVFRGQDFARINARQRLRTMAQLGVARTFQNLALFKGMSVVDNLKTGRNLKMNICDRVVVLDHGRKIGDGTPDEVRADPEVISAYLGTAAESARAKPAGPAPGEVQAAQRSPHSATEGQT